MFLIKFDHVSDLQAYFHSESADFHYGIWYHCNLKPGPTFRSSFVPHESKILNRKTGPKASILESTFFPIFP